MTTMTIERFESAVNNYEIPEKYMPVMSARYSDIISDPQLLAQTIIWIEKFPRVLVGVGYYAKGSDIFRVKESKAGRHYAEKLHGTKWKYSAGDIYKLKIEDKLTAELAAEYGRRTGNCAICGRTLTNPDSVKRGIGPVCLERLGG